MDFLPGLVKKLSMKTLTVFGLKLTGVTAHKWQTYSALYLLFFFPYFALKISNITIVHATQINTVLNTLFTPIFTFSSLIACMFILIHAWVGLRDIMIDYLPQNTVQIWLQLYALFLLFIAVDLLFLIIHFL